MGGVARMLSVLCERLHVTLPDGAMANTHGIAYGRMVKATTSKSAEGRHKKHIAKTKKRKLNELEQAKATKGIEDHYDFSHTAGLLTLQSDLSEIEQVCADVNRAKKQAQTAVGRSKHAKHVASRQNPDEWWHCPGCQATFKRAAESAHAKKVVTHFQSCSKYAPENP